MKEKTRLDFEQIKTLCESPKNGKTIRMAKEQSIRAMLHSENYQSRSEAGQSYNQFWEWVKEWLHEDKAASFSKYLRFPIESSKLVNSMKKELSKCFEANDRYLEHIFSDDENTNSFNEYLKEKKVENFIREKVFPSFFSSPNDFIVITQPEGKSSPAQPYPIFVPISDVKDFDLLDNMDLDYLIYKEGSHIFAIDRYKYHRLEINEDGELIESSYLDPDHNQEMPLARQASPMILSSDKPLLKKGFLSEVQTDLDHYLFKSVSKFDNSLYALYPKFWMYEQKCSFESYAGRLECSGGKMILESIQEDGSIVPVKGRCFCHHDKMKLRGPGSTIEIPVPEKDEPDIGQPLGVVTVPVEVLKQIQDEIDRTAKDIYYSVVGRDGMEDNRQHNELRVQGSFESKQNVLVEAARIFADIELFIYEAIGKIRFSDYKETILNEGQNFFIHTISELNSQFKEASISKIPFFQRVIGEKLIETEFRNDPAGLEKEKIKQALNPYYFFSEDQLLAIKEDIGVDAYLFYRKFDSLIARFEAENVAINKVAPDSEMSVRLNLIFQFLILIHRQNEELFSSPPTGGNIE